MKHQKITKQLEKFTATKNKFKLFIDNNLVSEANFTIEQPDKWFNKKYATLYNLKTFKKFRNQGFAKKLLNYIFQYIKNELKINTITLLVYKNNIPAINLYLTTNFKIFQNFENDNPSFILIKKL